MLLRLGVARRFLLREPVLEGGHFLFYFGEPSRFEVSGHDAVPLIEGLLPLRLGETVLTHLGVYVAEMAQNRGVMVLAAGSLPKQFLGFLKIALLVVGPSQAVLVRSVVRLFH